MQEQQSHPVRTGEWTVSLVKISPDLFLGGVQVVFCAFLFDYANALAISSCATPVVLSHELRVTLRMSWTM